MKTLLAFLLSILFIATPISSIAQEVDRTKMSKSHQRAFDASLAVFIDEGDGPRFTCSSTVVAHAASQTSTFRNSYLLLTAGHCVLGDGRSADSKYFIAEDLDKKVKFQSVKVVKAENDDAYDFALLELQSDKEYPSIKISGKNGSPDLEDKVYGVNFSLGLAKQVALGVVASKEMTGDAECSPCKGRYLVHLFEAAGASGSSIIDEKSGEIVGVTELGFPGANVGLAAETMDAFREFLSKPVETISPKAQSLRASRIAQ